MTLRGVIAFFFYNFFFTQTYGRLQIDDPAERTLAMVPALRGTSFGIPGHALQAAPMRRTDWDQIQRSAMQPRKQPERRQDNRLARLPAPGARQRP